MIFSSNWIEIGILIIAFLGIFIAWHKFTLLTRQNRKYYEWSMRQNALSYSLTDNPDLRRIRITLDKAFQIPERLLKDPKEPIPLDEIKNHCDGNPRLYNAIVFFLAHWENMALAIYAKVAHEKVAFEQCANWVVLYTHLFTKFIGERRQVNPRAYDYLLKLARFWREKIENMPAPIFSDLREDDGLLSQIKLWWLETLFYRY